MSKLIIKTLHTIQKKIHKLRDYRVFQGIRNLGPRNFRSGPKVRYDFLPGSKNHRKFGPNSNSPHYLLLKKSYLITGNWYTSLCQAGRRSAEQKGVVLSRTAQCRAVRRSAEQNAVMLSKPPQYRTEQRSAEQNPHKSHNRFLLSLINIFRCMIEKHSLLYVGVSASLAV